MGVTIHYRGRLNDVAQADAITVELIDIATSMQCPLKQIAPEGEPRAGAALPGGEAVSPHFSPGSERAGRRAM